MNISFQNVIDADGIGVAITGMFIVFSGLVLISLYIASIPKLLALTEKAAKKRAEKPAPVETKSTASTDDEEGEINNEMLAAIAYVIRKEKEYEDTADHQRITIQKDDSQQVWAVTGRLRNLSNRM